MIHISYNPHTQHAEALPEPRERIFTHTYKALMKVLCHIYVLLPHPFLPNLSRFWKDWWKNKCKNKTNRPVGENL